jgi:hypothetical protein
MYNKTARVLTTISWADFKVMIAPPFSKQIISITDPGSEFKNYDI